MEIAELLSKYSFVGVYLVARESRESYKDIIEELKPNILIEDDCKSIGGSWQMCIHKVEPRIKEKIKSIVVAEFKGIDQLTTEVNELITTK